MVHLTGSLASLYGPLREWLTFLQVSLLYPYLVGIYIGISTHRIIGATRGWVTRVFAPRHPHFHGSTDHSFGDNLTTYNELFTFSTHKFNFVYLARNLCHPPPPEIF